MAETIDLANNSVLVTDPADTDRVAIMRGPSPKTVTLADLAKAVRQSIRFSARNLLLGSNKSSINSGYSLISYGYAYTLVVGETYTLTAKITFGSEGVVTAFKDNRGAIIKKFYGTPGTTKVVTAVYTCPENQYEGNSRGLDFYQGSQAVSGTGASVEWATLVKGEIPLLDWVPAPEDLQNSGGVKRYASTLSVLMQRDSKTARTLQGRKRPFRDAASRLRRVPTKLYHSTI